MNEGRASANSLNIVAREHKLVLDILAPHDRDTSVKVDGTNNLEGDSRQTVAKVDRDLANLLAKEVADEHLLSVTFEADVDGEMGVDQAHLVLEALGDTGNHVLDVRGDCADTGVALALSEPKKSAKLSASLKNLQVHFGMLERALERSTGSGHLDNAAVRLDGDCATW